MSKIANVMALMAASVVGHGNAPPSVPAQSKRHAMRKSRKGKVSRPGSHHFKAYQKRQNKRRRKAAAFNGRLLLMDGSYIRAKPWGSPVKPTPIADILDVLGYAQRRALEKGEPVTWG